MTMTSPAPLLVLGVGNPSRGDDALGPLFIDALGARLQIEIAGGDIELLTDYQLQLEHALDLTGRERVVFVDASVAVAPPFRLTRVVPGRDASLSTHALSPAALLETHRAVVGEPPESWVLAIRGETFELGEPLSNAGQAHLAAALDFFVADTRGRSAREGTRPPEPAGRRFAIEGIVQGVGFRPWVFRTARKLGLTGAVFNTNEGVTIEAFGEVTALDALLRALQESPPAAASLRTVSTTSLPGPPPPSFVIAPSVLTPALNGAAVERPSSRAPLSLSPDLGICPDCAREINDPEARRHRYPFTTCAQCGPRLSLAASLPFDRASTSMASFALCAACACEYQDPRDRRFHAQTIACPDCGPRLWLADREGRALGEPGSDPLAGAIARLGHGEILAVQGLGAFHLMCDASNDAAVARLRARKRREAQPFAVLVPSEAAAEALVTLEHEARLALTSATRPIVLAPSRDAGILAAGVNGPSRRTGVMLPHTPLQLLLSEGVGRPLVATSANPSGGPAAITHDDARAALSTIADAFVFHDRPILRRVEDAVMMSEPGVVRVVRRARGQAPRPVRLPVKAPADTAVLAVGGHMKNTACLVIGDEAYLTPHLGELALVESEDAWRRDVEGFERLLGVRAEVLAHDLHPGYAATRYALARPARTHVGVQHHVAHVQAAIAELHLDEPVVGVVFDGTGWGPDGTSWGAELLLVEGERWTRAASFRPVVLPGGEAAIHDVWRAALAALVDALGSSEALARARRLPAFREVTPTSRATVARLCELALSDGACDPSSAGSALGAVKARGLGRWFDVFGALVLGLPRASFDAHVAIALEDAARDAAVEAESGRPFPVGLPQALALDEAADASARLSEAHEIDLRPTVRAVVDALEEGHAPALVAARLHRTVVEATADTVVRLLGATGLRQVVLAGGCFQNQLLVNDLRARLGATPVAMAREVPVNDGGLALGQAYAAVLALARGRD